MKAIKIMLPAALIVIIVGIILYCVHDDRANRSEPPDIQPTQEMTASPTASEPNATEHDPDTDTLSPDTNVLDAIYHKISAAEAKKMMDSGEEYLLLDVRTDTEFAESHIAGAVLIPDYEITARAESALPDKSALILVYCRSGRRSANVAHTLVGMGYTNVYNFGGIIDWPYGTVSE